MTKKYFNLLILLPIFLLGGTIHAATLKCTAKMGSTDITSKEVPDDLVGDYTFTIGADLSEGQIDGIDENGILESTNGTTTVGCSLDSSGPVQCGGTDTYLEQDGVFKAYVGLNIFRSLSRGHILYLTSEQPRVTYMAFLSCI
jgi:hypothetical protein